MLAVDHMSIAHAFLLNASYAHVNIRSQTMVERLYDMVHSYFALSMS